MITIIGFSIISLFIIFFCVFSDSCGVPGASASIIATASLARNIPSLLVVIGIVYCAACLGDICAYSFARFISRPLIHKLRRFSFFKEGEPRARKLLSKYEFLIIFLSRFTMGSLCPIMNYIAGIEKLNRAKFILAVLTGEFFYACIFSIVGFAFGELATSLLGTVNYTIITIVLVVLGLFVIRWMLRKNN